MDLDELKNRTRAVRAPVLTPAGAVDPGRVADDLISRMKAEDARDAKSLRGMMMFFGVAGAFMTALFTLTWLFPPDQDPNVHRILLALMGLLFLSFGAMHRAKSRELSGIDYTRTVRSFLDDSERRYRFCPLRGLSFTIPYLVLLLVLLATSAVSWIHAMHRYFPAMEDSTGIILFCALMIVAGVIGLISGRKDWRKRKAPILEELRRMKAELTREEPDDRDEN
jgi:hypothetical protein